MRRNMLLALLAVLVANAPPVLAQEKGDECSITDTPLTLREQPPSGLIYKAGKWIGNVEANDVFVVTETKHIKTLYAEYIYVRGEVRDKKNSLSKMGWVYAGNVGGRSFLKCRGTKR